MGEGQAKLDQLTRDALSYPEFDWTDPNNAIEGAKQLVVQAKAAVDAVARQPNVPSAQLVAAEKAYAEASAELARRTDLLDRIRGEIDRGARTPALPAGQAGIVGQIGEALWYPVGTALTIAGEIVLGVGQSPQEMWDILLAGQRNIRWFEIRRRVLDREIRVRSFTVDVLRQRLEQCTATATARAATAGARA